MKRILQLGGSDTSLDAEIAEVLPSGDALTVSLLKQKSLTVPNPVPQNVADSAAYFVAWMIRRSRDPVGAEAFWVEANRFLDAYVDAETVIYVGRV